MKLLDAIADVEVYDLAQPLFNGMPCSPNHPGFHFSLQRRHGDMVRPDGGSAANELIVTGGHVGTHVDAIAHVSHDGRLHGGHDAVQAQVGGRFSIHGIDQMAPVVARGLLLDVAEAKGCDVLAGGCGITPDDLEEAESKAEVRLSAGDVALVRTGWAQRFDDPAGYLGHDTGVPGCTEAAARWLAARGARVVGSDTTAFEQIPAGAGHRVLPGHRVLLVEHGIHIVEHMNLEPLAAAGVREFVFVLAPLRIVGGTGSPVRPLALVSR
jgi:kynurenine formamidase